MKLSVLISTIDKGIWNVENILLDERNDVEYIICHQYTHDMYKVLPDWSIRKDVRIKQLFGRGLTKSRNIAIELAEGDICLISDDDVRYRNDYIETILEAYKDRAIEVACFKIQTLNNEPEYKRYPSKKKKLIERNQYSPSSIEITFRRESIIKSKISFDERFGLGSWLNGGGENLFIWDAIEKRLNVFFIPEFIVIHPYISTVKTLGKYHIRRNRIVGALDARLFGYKSIVKSFYYAIKLFPDLLRNEKSPVKYFLERLHGALFIMFKLNQYNR